MSPEQRLAAIDSMHKYIGKFTELFRSISIAIEGFIEAFIGGFCEGFIREFRIAYEMKKGEGSFERDFMRSGDEKTDTGE